MKRCLTLSLYACFSSSSHGPLHPPSPLSLENQTASAYSIVVLEAHLILVKFIKSIHSEFGATSGSTNLPCIKANGIQERSLCNYLSRFCVCNSNGSLGSPICPSSHRFASSVHLVDVARAKAANGSAFRRRRRLFSIDKAFLF